jgi:ribonuclease T
MIFLSVDIEADGPAPGEYSLRSIGAVPVGLAGKRWMLLEDEKFYVELEPEGDAKFLPEARSIFERQLDGQPIPPREAMQRFKAYVNGLREKYQDDVITAAKPVVFDGAFINWSFWHHLQENPLGYKAFDIGSYLEGLFGIAKAERNKRMTEAGYIEPSNPRLHHALFDAVEQAQTLVWALNHAAAQSRALTPSEHPTSEALSKYLSSLLMIQGSLELVRREVFEQSKRVQGILLDLMPWLGFDATESKILEAMTGLYDIGFVGVGDALWYDLKQQDFNREAMALVGDHTITGAKLLINLPAVQGFDASRVAIAHHEHWDGTGIPYQFKGSAIPIEARLAALALEYDRLTHIEGNKHDRVQSGEEVLEGLRMASGTFLDPFLVAALIASLQN